ncbi:hypothetical protein EMIT0P44_20103 [Pseudomonas sp. IT-P44]
MAQGRKASINASKAKVDTVDTVDVYRIPGHTRNFPKLCSGVSWYLTGCRLRDCEMALGADAVQKTEGSQETWR